MRPPCSAQTVAGGEQPLHHPGCRTALVYRKVAVWKQRKEQHVNKGKRREKED